MSTKIPLGGGYPFMRQKCFSIRGTKIHENTVILQFETLYCFLMLFGAGDCCLCLNCTTTSTIACETKGYRLKIVQRSF